MSSNQEPDRHPPIGPYTYVDYQNASDAFRPYNREFPTVAARVIALVQAVLPEVVVEHIGSSAIPGCPGKGVVDLMLVYPPGMLAAARDAVDALGFQRHDRPGAFSEERPVRIGTIEQQGMTYRVHLHLLAETNPEVVDQRRFRDALRADPALVAEYTAIKQRVLTAGVADADAYNAGKDAFIQRVMGKTLSEE
jgi:GrpB-like predicted nucleotidyltransferase (UPF0157 family)